MAEFIRGIQSEKERYREAAARATAQLENYKKEAARQAQQRERSGAERVILALLPVLENMDTALSYADQEPDPQALKQGVEMIRQQLVDTLEALGLQKVEPGPGQDFDPALMEAAASTASSEHRAGAVVQLVSAGYMFKGRLIRPARVVVCGERPIEEAEKR